MPGDNAFDLVRLATLRALARPTAHEIRGAIGSVMVHVELLEASLLDEPTQSDRQRRHLDVIRRQQKQLERCMTLFIDLVDAPPSAAAVDLAAVVDDAAAAIVPLAKDRRVTVAVTRPPEPVPVAADRETLRQGVLDLLLRAVRDGAPGTTVTAAVSVRGNLAALAVGAAAELSVPLASPTEKGQG